MDLSIAPASRAAAVTPNDTASARPWFSTRRAGRVSACCNNRSAAGAARRCQATPSSGHSICSISRSRLRKSELDVRPTSA
ncbi:hypothetical protein GFL51_30800 [Rhizobium leguminosarum bv. viciae]|nr:hypothetical protein [Rhizobium leguminosarum bv. viciae]